MGEPGSEKGSRHLKKITRINRYFSVQARRFLQTRPLRFKGEKMTVNCNLDQGIQLRSEMRLPVLRSASLSLKPPGSEWTYHIKLRDFSSSGLGLLVREDSDLLKYIQVGDVFSVTYHEDTSPGTVRTETVQIRHISPPATGKPENHVIVGVSFCDRVK